MSKIKKLINGVLVLLLIFLLVLGFRELYGFHQIESDQKVLRESVLKVPKEGQGEELDPNDPLNRYIDFNALWKINPDISGWVYIPGTKIDYPILIGKTDEKYLHRDYTDAYSYAGSIFAYAFSNLNTDSHTCLFGHNMVSGQMFGGLKKYKNLVYAEEHQKMYLYTPGRTKECTLISVFGCKNTDTVFDTEKAEEREGTTPLQIALKDRSILQITDSDELETNGQIYTLGTCNGYRGSNQRFTIHFTETQEKCVIQ